MVLITAFIVVILPEHIASFFLCRFHRGSGEKEEEEVCLVPHKFNLINLLMHQHIVCVCVFFWFKLLGIKLFANFYLLVVIQVG